MADQKVSNLPALNGADVDSADLLYIVDSSAGTAGSKKITIGQYQLAPVSGGTANGVTYLNGSKVQTSGSALTFDGTNLGIGTSSPLFKLDARGASGAGINYIETTTGNTNRIQLGATAGLGYINATAGTGSPSLQFQVADAEKMRLDSSGNLGLGVTPSAWSIIKAIEIGSFRNSVFSDNGSVSVGIASGSYYNAGWKYAVTGSAVGYYEVAGNAHRWFTAPSGTAGNAITFTQAMTLDASGNLGVGTTSPDTRLHVDGSTNTTIRVTSATNTDFRGFGIGNTESDGTEYASLKLNASSGELRLYVGPNTYGGFQTFYTNGSERARITIDGNLLVGLDSSIASDVKLNVKNSTSATATSGFWNATTTGDSVFVGFGTEAAYTSRGSIDYNRAGGLVRYNTTSDYRAKDILGPVADPGATIDALKVYEGRMKGATQSRPMLVAHEAQEHAPYAVSGVKDEVNDDGTPKYQQMDVSSLVPLLIAEIQSLRARVAALEAK